VIEKLTYFPSGQFSLSIKLSTNLACEFMHIKGTRRFQSSHVNNADNSWKYWSMPRGVIASRAKNTFIL
jgi:hypothetical protein